MVARNTNGCVLPQDVVLLRRFGSVEVRARETDKYVDATALCNLAGRAWFSYVKRKETKRFLKALENQISAGASNGVPALVETTGGRGGHTWIHPQVVIHFIQWASPEFAVQVTEWVQELLTTGSVRVGNAPAAPALNVTQLKEELRNELREEVRIEVMATVAPMLAEMQSLTAPPQHDRMTTIRDQCRHWGWHNPSAKQQTEIRNRAYELHFAKYGEPPTKLWGRCLWVGEEQIAMLNQAIMDVRCEYDSRLAQSGPHIPGTV